MIDFFGIPSLHKHTRDTRDDLETLKTYLRVKCCKDMYVLEHSAANDPEAWTKLDEIGEKMQNLRRILNGTENLVFSSSEDKENLAGNYYIFIKHFNIRSRGFNQDLTYIRLLEPNLTKSDEHTLVFSRSIRTLKRIPEP